MNLLCNNKSHRFADIGMLSDEGTPSNWHNQKWGVISECFAEELSKISVQNQCMHYNHKSDIDSNSQVTHNR